MTTEKLSDEQLEKYAVRNMLYKYSREELEPILAHEDTSPMVREVVQELLAEALTSSNKGYPPRTRTKTCRTCAWRDEDRYCTSEKITDDDWKERRSDEARADMLIYGQFEEGGFRAGDNFGCVHHKEKEDQ